MRGKLLGITLALVAGCADEPSTDTTSNQALTAAQQAGRETWLKATFGGEKFFSVLAPNVLHLHLGLDAALTSPRATRFQEWGLINQPGCIQGSAATGFLDYCPDDPESAGVVGVRKKAVKDANGNVTGFLVGVSCASCHAGFDAQNPPVNPNEPTWDNIHLTAGNQYINIGKIFGYHLPHDSAEWQVFNTWKPGTVDTTAIESDGINNPGIITQFFSTPDRPYFNLHDMGLGIKVHRGGQGGEDDVGCEKAALRVYFNIGMCAAECMIPHLPPPVGAGGEIDDAACSAACPDYVAAKAAVGDMCDFMSTTTAPKLEAAPNGASYINHTVIGRGKKVFEQNCAGCHSNGKPSGADKILSDDQIHLQPLIGTNACRSLTTNWMAGRIWGQFSSDEYKHRLTGGPGFYRDVPLHGIWSTAPFFHNNALGGYNGDPSVAGRIAAYEDAMDQLLNPWKRDLLGSIETSTTTVTNAHGAALPTPIPAGTPVAVFANADPTDPTNLLKNKCLDLLENQGHYFGATLSASDKYALTEYLKTK